MSAQDSGIICMSITPFAMDGGLDEEAIRAHLGRMAAAEVGVVLGSLGTGEGHLLRRGRFCHTGTEGVAPPHMRRGFVGAGDPYRP